MSDSQRKLILVGVDGVCPELLERFCESGDCPRLAELATRGSLARILPAPPGDAATVWATLVTGAGPGAHGVCGLLGHESGTEFAQPSPSPLMDAEKEALAAVGGRIRSRAMWDSMIGAGSRLVTVNFPGVRFGVEGAVTVRGTGPVEPGEARLSDASVFATREAGATGATNVLRTTQPSGWANAPDSARAPLETALIITGEADLQPTSAGWMTAGDGSSQVSPSLMYCGLLTASGAGEGEDDPAFDTLVLCKGRDGEHPVASLTEGEWSEWIVDEIPTAGGPREVKFKLQLRSLSAGGREIALYRTPLFGTTDWASPPEVADSLIEASIADPEPAGLTGPEALAWTCRRLCAEVEWDVLAAYTPALDAMLHGLHSTIDPANPTYVADEAAEAWERVRQALVDLDKFIGAVLDGSGEDEPIVGIISAHGQLSTRRFVWLAKWLIEADLMTYVADEDTGKLRLHWPDTRVVLADDLLAQGVWVNLRGRDPQGAVDSDEYESTRTAAISALLSARDPQTGACPVSLAIRREDAGFLGLSGEAVPDVVVMLEPQYMCDPRLASTGLIDASLVSADGFRDATGPLKGVHHGFLPGAELGGGSVQGWVLLAGPGVRAGYVRPAPLWSTDVAPTLCHILGVPRPSSAEGCVALDLTPATGDDAR